MRKERGERRTCGTGNDASPALLLGELAHEVVGAAQLEREDGRHVLALERDLVAEPLRELHRKKVGVSSRRIDSEPRRRTRRRGSTHRDGGRERGAVGEDRVDAAVEGEEHVVGRAIGLEEVSCTAGRARVSDEDEAGGGGKRARGGRGELDARGTRW